MSSKPETTFIQSIHRHLPKEVYREKMANPYRGGTPDVWYSGYKNDLWVEYKFIPKLAVRVPNKIEVSELQRLWLEARQSEGRNVAVIVGHPGGGMVLFVPFTREINTDVILANTLTRTQLADWIYAKTNGAE